MHQAGGKRRFACATRATSLTEAVSERATRSNSRTAPRGDGKRRRSPIARASKAVPGVLIVLRTTSDEAGLRQNCGNRGVHFGSVTSTGLIGRHEGFLYPEADQPLAMCCVNAGCCCISATERANSGPIASAQFAHGGEIAGLVRRRGPARAARLASDAPARAGGLERMRRAPGFLHRCLRGPRHAGDQRRRGLLETPRSTGRGTPASPDRC